MANRARLIRTIDDCQIGSFSDIAANIYLAIYWIEGIGIGEYDEDIKSEAKRS